MIMVPSDQYMTWCWGGQATSYSACLNTATMYLHMCGYIAISTWDMVGSVPERYQQEDTRVILYVN